MRSKNQSRTAGRPHYDPSRNTRVQLLNAASQLFAEQGVAATTFAVIASRAGVTPAMVHYHFRDRDELIDAVVEERLVPFIKSVWGPVQPEQTPAELVHGLVRRLLTQIEQEPWVPSTWMREILNEGGLLRERLLRHLPFDKVRMLGHSVGLAQQLGRANLDVDPLLFVFSALGLVMLHMATLRVWSEIFHREPSGTLDLERHIVAILLHGLEPNRKPPLCRPRPKRTQRRNA